MRIKCIAVSLLLGIANVTTAQTNSFPSSGNVGIGVSSPAVKLHVVSGESVGVKSVNGVAIIESVDAQLDIISNSSLSWGSSINLIEGNGTLNRDSWSITRQTTGGIGDSSLRFNFGTRNDNINGNKVTFKADGAVGIGTVNPTHMLHVAGNAKWTGNASSYTEINSNSNGQYMIQYANNGTSRSWIIRGFSNNGVQAEFNNGGINVNGVIKTKEVNVTSSGWADHVFEPGYELMDLDGLEEFIRSRGHLPHIPTAAEVKETGVNLAEMNVKLLEKVEELTLYLIGQNRRLLDQEERVLSLKSELEELRKSVLAGPGQ